MIFLRNTPRKYNASGYTSGTDTTINLRTFVLMAYICGFRKDFKMIEYTKYQWTDQKHHDALQWTRKDQNIICYDNELKFMYLLRE